MLALYGDLARAVRRESNQAIDRHWGVTGQTVIKWRKASDAHYNLADLLSKLGRHEEAKMHWKEYLEVDPAIPWREEVLRRLSLASN
jgi:tetratricopeptide (TPR) repeat protein